MIAAGLFTIAGVIALSQQTDVVVEAVMFIVIAIVCWVVAAVCALHAVPTL